MAADSHSLTLRSSAESTVTVVYTDGACSGNPGPGGWAWVQVDGAWASGFESTTTNQRMEIQAALAACEAFDGALRIVSDSTYVVNCWRDRWWQGWLARGWRNSAKKPVANRDLWELLVPHFRDRPELELEWVKGHSGDRWNDTADRLAVAAVERRRGSSGSSPPSEDDLGDEDPPMAGGSAAVSGDRADRGRSDTARERDPRVPHGFLMTVTGMRAPVVLSATAELARIVAAWAQVHADAIVLTGLRAGAEALAVDAAAAAEVPYVVVLPYPEPDAGWSEADRERFAGACDGAARVVVLERRRPTDGEGRRKALARRDGWLRSVSDLAIVVTDGRDVDAERVATQWEKVLGDDVWRLEVDA